MGATAAVAGVSILSGYLAGENEKEKSRFQQRIANANADLDEARANRLLANADTEVGDYRKKVKSVVGTQRAAYAAQGVDVSFGTPVEIEAETQETAGEDISRMRRNATLEAYGIRMGAQDKRDIARMNIKAANNFATNSLINAGLQGAQYYAGRKG